MTALIFATLLALNTGASNAIGILYADGPFKSSYGASAQMRLPQVPHQHSWHAVWLMFVNGGGNPPGFVQGGLIRWAQNDYHLSAFIAMALPDHDLVFKDLGRVSEGPHRVELSGDARYVWFRLDGKVVYRFERARYLTNALRPYLQIGAEVKYPPDAGSGEVWDLHLKRDTDAALQSFTPHCTYEDRGIQFIWNGSRYVATGTFDPQIASKFDDCGGFNSASQP